MFLCTTTFDHWESVKTKLRLMCNPNTPIAQLRQLLPSVAAIAGTMHEVVRAQDTVIYAAAAKLTSVHDKMDSDTKGRLADTLKVLRACRLFGYEFWATNTLETIQHELVQVLYLSVGMDTGEFEFRGELSRYKELADIEYEVPAADRITTETFWNRYKFDLPTWHFASREVALVTPSSATVERLFSLLTQGFGDNQVAALQDYKKTCCLIRYNYNFSIRDV